jgi:hypothetical protein
MAVMIEISGESHQHAAMKARRTQRTVAMECGLFAICWKSKGQGSCAIRSPSWKTPSSEIGFLLNGGDCHWAFFLHSIFGCVIL